MIAAICSGDVGSSGPVASTQADLELKHWWNVFDPTCDTAASAARRQNLTALIVQMLETSSCTGLRISSSLHSSPALPPFFVIG